MWKRFHSFICEDMYILQLCDSKAISTKLRYFYYHQWIKYYTINGLNIIPYLLNEIYSKSSPISEKLLVSLQNILIHIKNTKSDEEIQKIFTLIPTQWDSLLDPIINNSKQLPSYQQNTNDNVHLNQRVRELWPYDISIEPTFQQKQSLLNNDILGEDTIKTSKMPSYDIRGDHVSTVTSQWFQTTFPTDKHNENIMANPQELNARQLNEIQGRILFEKANELSTNYVNDCDKNNKDLSVTKTIETNPNCNEIIPETIKIKNRTLINITTPSNTNAIQENVPSESISTTQIIDLLREMKYPFTKCKCLLLRLYKINSYSLFKYFVENDITDINEQDMFGYTVISRIISDKVSYSQKEKFINCLVDSPKLDLRMTNILNRTTLMIVIKQLIGTNAQENTHKYPSCKGSLLHDEPMNALCINHSSMNAENVGFTGFEEDENCYASISNMF